MAYESCAQCGAKKHKLVACKACGFKNNDLKPIKNNRETVLNRPAQEDESAACSICGAVIKKKNLLKHYKNKHPNELDKNKLKGSVSRQGFGDGAKIPGSKITKYGKY